MLYVAAIVVGMVGSSAAIWVARRLDRERVIFGWALVLAAFWYVGFGVVAGQPLAAMASQLVAGAGFLVVAYLGLTRSLAYLGVGWILHIFWDFLGPFAGEVVAPWWTAPACLGFDVIVGTYLLLRTRGFAPLPQESPT